MKTKNIIAEGKGIGKENYERREQKCINTYTYTYTYTYTKTHTLVDINFNKKKNFSSNNSLMGVTAQLCGNKLI